jgi:ribosomal protein S18 acetylase RimI-like enzyme
MPAPVHPDASVRAWLAGQVADVEHETWVADVDGRVVAFAAFTATWLDELYVLPRRQHEGVGGALLELVKSLRPNGFGLWVFESNVQAQAFYRGHGLVVTGGSDGSQNEERAPDLLMEWRA